MNASLSDLMAEALRDVADISDMGARARSYVAAGIELHNLPKDDARHADQMALSMELIKRMDCRDDLDV